AEWASTFVERRPIRQIEHFARAAADHVSPHGYFADLASEPEREVSPPPGVEGEEVRAELRREPLDELDARADVVARGPRERQARKSAEPDDVERRAIADVRDGARVTEQHALGRRLHLPEQAPRPGGLGVKFARGQDGAPTLHAKQQCFGE